MEIKNFTRGFTLIELLMVMAVIGVLASVVLISVNPLGQFRKARDAQRKADLRQIQSALEMFRADNGYYPYSTGYNYPSCNTALTFGGVSYMSKVPCDPNGGTTTGYTYSDLTSTGRSYQLTACLENGSDPQRDNPTVACTPVAGSANSGALITVTNP